MTTAYNNIMRHRITKALHSSISTRGTVLLNTNEMFFLFFCFYNVTTSHYSADCTRRNLCVHERRLSRATGWRVRHCARKQPQVTSQLLGVRVQVSWTEQLSPIDKRQGERRSRNNGTTTTWRRQDYESSEWLSSGHNPLWDSVLGLYPGLRFECACVYGKSSMVPVTFYEEYLVRVPGTWQCYLAHSSTRLQNDNGRTPFKKIHQGRVPNQAECWYL
jgi:hypothetical protein